MLASRRNLVEFVYALILALVAFVFFAYFRASESLVDALGFALRGAQDFNFHPAHLLYPASVRVWYLALGSRSTCDAWCAGQVQSMVGATVAVLAFYALLAHLLRSRSAAFLGSLFLIFTNAFWQWATQVDSYASITAMIAIQAAMLIRKETEVFRTSEVMIIVGLLTTSLLYHQGALLFCVPLSYYLVSVWGRPGFVALIKILGVSGTLTVAIYGMAYLAESGYLGSQGFVEWVFTYPLHPEWGTSENLSIPSLRQALESQAKSILTVPGDHDLLVWVIGASVLGIIAIIVAWNAIQVARQAGWRRERTFFLIWFLTYFCFLVWWGPHMRQFLIPSNMAVVALGALAARDWSRFAVAQRLSGGVGWLTGLAFVFVLMVSNLIASVWPSHVSRGPYYEEAVRMHAVAPKNCVIIVEENRVGFHLQYAFGAKVLRNPLPVLYGIGRGAPLTDLLGRGGPLTARRGCKMMSVQLASPDWTIHGRNGSTNVAEWLQFFRWSINACRETAADDLRYNSLLIRQDKAGYLYMVVDDLETRRAAHLGEVLAELDDRVTAYRADWDHTYSAWWRQNMKMRSKMKPGYDECELSS
jgi:hypothetical protein